MENLEDLFGMTEADPEGSTLTWKLIQEARDKVGPPLPKLPYMIICHPDKFDDVLAVVAEIVTLDGKPKIKVKVWDKIVNSEDVLWIYDPEENIWRT
jgi:hypothetical protein